MLATTGFLQRRNSFQIRSLASADPPGLSTRRTIALTVLSSSAWRIASTIVDEPLLDRLLRRERPAVDQLLDLFGAEMILFARGDDAVDDAMVVVVVEDALELLAVLGAELVARERLGGSLEGAHLQHVGLDADLVEEVLEEHGLGPDAGQHEPARLGEVDLVAGQGDQVVTRTAGFEIGERLFAGLAE